MRRAAWPGPGAGFRRCRPGHCRPHSRALPLLGLGTRGRCCGQQEAYQVYRVPIWGQTSSFSPVHKFLFATWSILSTIYTSHKIKQRMVKYGAILTRLTCTRRATQERGRSYCPKVGSCGRSGRGSSCWATGLLAKGLDPGSASGPVMVGGRGRWRWTSVKSLEVPLPLPFPFRLRRLYGCLTPGSHTTPARTHPLHGLALSQRTLRCLQRIHEYSCCCWCCCWCWPEPLVGC